MRSPNAGLPQAYGKRHRKRDHLAPRLVTTRQLEHRPARIRKQKASLLVARHELLRYQEQEAFSSSWHYDR